MAIRESIFRQLEKRKNSESAAARMEEMRKEIILIDQALGYFREKK